MSFISYYICCADFLTYAAVQLSAMKPAETITLPL